MATASRAASHTSWPSRIGIFNWHQESLSGSVSSIQESTASISSRIFSPNWIIV
jgi:hypothetical protein